MVSDIIIGQSIFLRVNSFIIIGAMIIAFYLLNNTLKYFY